MTKTIRLLVLTLVTAFCSAEGCNDDTHPPAVECVEKNVGVSLPSRNHRWRLFTCVQVGPGQFAWTFYREVPAP